MGLSIFIYPTNSEEIIYNHKHDLNDVKSYYLSSKEEFRIVNGESDCIVIVNMKTKQYYIYYFIDCDYGIDELRKEISDHIRISKNQLTRGKLIRFQI